MAGILAQLSSQRARPVPWVQVQQAVDGAIRARLVELDANSATWPCDPSAAGKVLLKATTAAATSTGGGGSSTGGTSVKDNGIAYRALLQPNELQDLADGLSDILALQAKHGIKIRFLLTVEAEADGDLKPEAEAELRNALSEVSESFH